LFDVRQGRTLNAQNNTSHIVLSLDGTVLNQLFASCMPQLQKTASRMLSTREDSEEALQDALLLGYRKLAQFKGESQFSTWMHAILVNAVRSLLRRQCARPRTTSLDSDVPREDERATALSIADPRANPEQEFHQEEIVRLTSKLLRALPSTYQPVVWLCDIEGFEMKEAAKKLGRPVGTIKCQLHRAHRLIRRHVHKQSSRSHSVPRRAFRRRATRHRPAASPSEASATKDLKLRPEPIPKPLWGHSAYQLLRRGAKWQHIRRDSLQAAGLRCAVCGAKDETLSCHGTWSYDETLSVSTLTGFIILCTACAAATNIGRAMRYGQGELALTQLAKVNGVSLKEAKNLAAEAMKLWRGRNAKSWRISVALSLLARYGDLRVLLPEAGEREASPAVDGASISDFGSASVFSEVAAD